jgi:hypothetical protein
MRSPAEDSTRTSRPDSFTWRPPASESDPIRHAPQLIAAIGSALLAGRRPRPGIAVMAQGGAWMLLAATVGILLVWQFAVTPLALAAAKLGPLREGLLTAGLDRLIPVSLLPGARPDPVSAATPATVAAVVVTSRALIPLAAGAWRTSTRC